MLDTLDNPGGWIEQNPNTDIQAADTVNFAQGVGSFQMLSVAAGVVLARKWLVGIDIAALEAASKSGLLLSYFHEVDAGVTGVIVRIVYAMDAAGVPTAYEEYQTPPNAGVAFAGFFRNEYATFSGASTAVGLTGKNDPLRRKAIALELEATASAAGQSIRFDAVNLFAGNSTNPCLLSSIQFGVHRLVLKQFMPWLRNPRFVSNVNIAPLAQETVLRSRWEQVRAELRQVFSDTQREGLRRFTEYVKCNNDWEINREAGNRYNGVTTQEAGPGGLTTDARRVDLDTTQELERLELFYNFPVRLRIGPSAKRDVEIAKVQEIVPGSHVILEEPLTYPHEVGTPVRSADFYPLCGLTNSTNPVNVNDRNWDFDLTFRETV